MKKIGLVTIGQSPRPDVLPEIEEILGKDTELLQAGALDGLEPEEIIRLGPEADAGTVLVSRLQDGGWVTLDEGKLIPLLEERISLLEEEGAALVVLLCTGPFPKLRAKTAPVIYPFQLMQAVLPYFSPRGRVGIVAPEEQQTGPCIDRWSGVIDHVTVASCNPYKKGCDLESAARVMRNADPDFIVLDCIGYNRNMKLRMEGLTGKPVILPRGLVAGVIREWC